MPMLFAYQNPMKTTIFIAFTQKDGKINVLNIEPWDLALNLYMNVW